MPDQAARAQPASRQNSSPWVSTRLGGRSTRVPTSATEDPRTRRTAVCREARSAQPKLHPPARPFHRQDLSRLCALTTAQLPEFGSALAAHRQSSPSSIASSPIYRGGKSAAELLTRLRSAPIAPLGLPSDTLAAIISAQVKLLRSLQAALAGTEHVIADRIARHPRTQLLQRRPGVGMIKSRPAARRSRTDPQPRRIRGTSSNRMRRSTGDEIIRQDHRRVLPMGSQYPCPQSGHILRAQRPHTISLGRQALRQRPRPRRTQPPRHPHRGSPGSASSGPAGTTAPTTTPNDTSLANGSSREELTQGTQTTPRHRHLPPPRSRPATPKHTQPLDREELPTTPRRRLDGQTPYERLLQRTAAQPVTDHRQQHI